MNLDRLLEVCEHPSVESSFVYIAENDSRDGTRRLLESYSNRSNKIRLLLLDSLSKKIPIREKRIAYCRDAVLHRIIADATSRNTIDGSALYVPVDLDSAIASSIDIEQFFVECEKVMQGDFDAIFPSSSPYYYDIFALRAQGWVEEDCAKSVRTARRYFGSFFSARKYVYKKQKPTHHLKGMIPVVSAFGGLGIYKLASVAKLKYFDEELLEEESTGYCEHVIFNRHVKSKAISAGLVVAAPQEHIRYVNGSVVTKAWIALRSFLSDGKNLIQRVLPKG